LALSATFRRNGSQGSNGQYVGDFNFTDEQAVWQQQSGEPLDEEMISNIALIIRGALLK
jgi:hypothetical protein